MTEHTGIAQHPPTERRTARSWLQMPRLGVLLCVVAFMLFELIGAYVSIEAQVALEGLAAFVMVNYAIFGYRTQRTTGLVSSALFATRLTTLTMPLAGISLSTRTAMLGATTVLVSYVATWVLGRDVSQGRVDEGFPLRPPLVSSSFTSAISVLSGFPIGWLAYELLEPHKLVMHPLFGATAFPWLFAIGALILGAFAEELLYRRLVAAMVQHAGQSQTPWVSAALYGSAFLGTHNVALVVLMTLSGAFFAWSCERTGTVKPVVTAHAIASILVFVVLPT